jgi:hypothetical protein
VTARVGDPSGDYLEPGGAKKYTDQFVNYYQELVNTYGDRGEMFVNADHDTGDVTIASGNMSAGVSNPEYITFKTAFNLTPEQIRAKAVEAFDIVGTWKEVEHDA